MINLNPGNFGGLAALAGTRVGGLGLQSPAEAYLKARGQNTEANIAQQKIASGERQSNLDRIAQQNQFSEQNKLAQQEMGMRQKEFDNKMEIQAMGLAKTREADEMQATAAFAMTVAQMSPEEWEKDKVSIINSMVQAGLADEDTGKKFVDMDHRTINRLSKVTAIMTGKASDYMKVMGEQESGSTKVYDPNTGKLVYESQPLTPSAKTDEQKSQLQMSKDFNNLGRIESHFNEKYLTTKGQQDLAVSRTAERLEGYPLIGNIAQGVAGTFTGKNKEERSQFLEEGTQFLNETEQFFMRYRKYITGAQAALKELSELRSRFLSGDMSSSEFRGSIRAIKDTYTADMGFQREALTKGVVTTKIATEADIAHTLKENPGTTRDYWLKQLRDRGYTIEGENQ